MNKSSIQFIEKNGRREWAIIPYVLYKHLLEDAEMTQDIASYDKVIHEDDGYRIPSEVTFSIVDGTHPIKAWREYKHLTLTKLANLAGISKAYLSQIESGKREGRLEVLSAICKALDVPLDVLTGSEPE